MEQMSKDSKELVSALEPETICSLLENEHYGKTLDSEVRKRNVKFFRSIINTLRDCRDPPEIWAEGMRNLGFLKAILPEFREYGIDQTLEVVEGCKATVALLGKNYNMDPEHIEIARMVYFAMKTYNEYDSSPKGF